MLRSAAYVTNKDLLREIAASKASFCWFEAPEAAAYHAIAPSANIVTDAWLTAICAELNLSRLRIERREEAAVSGKRKLRIADDEAAVPLAPDDLVVRVMSDAHVPREPPLGRMGWAKSAKAVRLPFPAFVHVQRRAGVLVEVGRSHWRGDLATGEFRLDHGRMTAALARLLVLLVDRYAMRANFRGYSYADEMRGNAMVQLAQVALQFDEAKSANPFGFFTQIAHNSFLKVLKSEKRVTRIRDDLLVMDGAMPSFGRQMEDEAAQAAPSVASGDARSLASGDAPSPVREVGAEKARRGRGRPRLARPAAGR